MVFLHPRVSRCLTLALAMIWVAAVASADVLQTPGNMRCHDMPCCPRSDGGMQSCSTAQCAEQAPEKAESQSAAKEPVRTSLPAMVAPATAAPPRFATAPRELTEGLRHSEAVFRLKDDLRI